MALVLALCSAQPAAAEDVDLPASVQAHFVSKVPRYDYGFRQRVGARVSVLIITAQEQPESIRTANLLAAALEREPDIAGLPHVSATLPFTDVASLLEQVKARSVSIVYLTAGLLASVDSICKALEPLSVMTLTPVPAYVERGVSVGFQVIGGRPQILVHLRHAEQSGLRFRSDLLKLAKVYR